jgi:hypothetical protein
MVFATLLQASVDFMILAQFWLYAESKPEDKKQQWAFNSMTLIGNNIVFEANLSYLKSIYDSFTNQNKKFLEINDLIQLCLQTSPCGVSEMDVRFCFGMCKMTIVMES